MLVKHRLLILSPRIKEIQLVWGWHGPRWCWWCQSKNHTLRTTSQGSSLGIYVNSLTWLWWLNTVSSLRNELHNWVCVGHFPEEILKLHCASPSPGGLVKTQMVRPHSQNLGFLRSEMEWKSAFLPTSQVLLKLLILESHFKNHCLSVI